MTKDLVALGNRARSIAIIAVVVAGATLVTGPAPARALARSFGAFAIPEGLAGRIAALRSRSSRRRRRHRDTDPAQGHEAVESPPSEAVETPPAEMPEQTSQTPENGSSRPRSGLAQGAPVIGYVTVPEGSVNGDLSPTERTIEQACERAGWQLVAIVRDPEGGRILDRPGLSHALAQIADGRAQALVVNDARLRDADAALIALDLGLDTSTAEGSRVASTLITLNGWAGERIARRARVAVSVRQEVLERVAAMHRDDVPLQAIADRLNADGERTPSGGEVWWPATVQTALRYWRSEARAPVEEVALERAVG
jgi:hypothetical protein